MRNRAQCLNTVGEFILFQQVFQLRFKLAISDDESAEDQPLIPCSIEDIRQQGRSFLFTDPSGKDNYGHVIRDLQLCPHRTPHFFVMTIPGNPDANIHYPYSLAISATVLHPFGQMPGGYNIEFQYILIANTEPGMPTIQPMRLLNMTHIYKSHFRRNSPEVGKK